MYQPNADCIGFCNWMLNLASQRLSGPQRILVTAVRDAAVGNYPVSDQTWLNFNLFTPWRDKYYQVFKDYASYTVPSLLTGLMMSLSFEGNTTDDTGNYTLTGSNITYGTGTGKILQGASFNGVNSVIGGAAISYGPNRTISFWLKPDITSSGRITLFAAGVGVGGLNYQGTVQCLEFVDYTGTWLSPAYSVPVTVWTHCLITTSANTFFVYINGTLTGTYVLPMSLAGFGPIGQYSVNYKGLMDILAIWNRVLSADEIAAVYNGGAGLQYPF